MTAKALSTVCLMLGAFGVFVEIANWFPTKNVGLIGAILVAAGVISIAITENGRSK